VKTLDAGHLYELDTFDGHCAPLRIRFMKREGEGYPGNVGSYPGTNCQDVIRVLIDRVKYLNNQIPHPENGVIIASLRTALEAFEIRAAERHGRSLTRVAGIEHEPACKECGHVGCGKHGPDA
jgi:hypothetical protein